MKLRMFVMLAGICAANFVCAQNAKADSVIINVGNSSKVIFAIGDKKDLETLKQYDMQAVVNDLISKLENKDTTGLEKPAADYVKTDPPVADNTTDTYRSDDNDDDDENWNDSWDRRDRNDRQSYNNYRSSSSGRRYYGRRTHHSMNFDLGMNNYLINDKFPDQNQDVFSVRPWGSWYFGINSTERTRLARKFFLEWTVGVSWYNFKFENEKLLVGRDSTGVTFGEDARQLNYVKTKLTATYLHASFIPLLDFGGNSRRAFFFDRNSDSFRIGAGPYVAYRVDSYTKMVYKDDDGEKQKERNHDNFYLNNLRYGARVQVGFRGTDVFFNYDMSTLFADGKGPKLQPFSFGITF